MRIIDEKDERINSFFSVLNNTLNRMEILFKNYKPVFDGERHITDEELSKRLHIHRRTLQEYRTNGLISYIHGGGKILYRESDIEDMLEKAYVKAWK